MNIITYLMESRGLVNAAQRLPTIAARFGVSAGRMQRALLDYARLAESFSAAPTLFVTGNLVERYPGVFKGLARRKVEFGIHGYVHTDYSALPLNRQRADMGRALTAFERLGIHADSFRGPYLKWNADSVSAARDLGLSFGSNRGVAWEVRGLNGKTPDLSAYEKGLRLYGAKSCSEMLSLPAERHGLLDMPASLPDDEAVVDRLRLDAGGQAAVWRGMVEQTHRQGELLVHTLHHERFHLCAPALKSMLEYATTLSPLVWTASLREIAEWWQRRASYEIAVTPSEGGFRVDLPDDGELTVVARGMAGPTEPWYGEWMTVAPGARIESEVAPWIVVPETASPAVTTLLRGEGFVVRPGGEGNGSLFLEGWEDFSPKDARTLLAQVESSDAPLVRLWRWPGGARSALSLTSDVDSMSLIDFVRRPLEV